MRKKSQVALFIIGIMTAAGCSKPRSGPQSPSLSGSISKTEVLPNSNSELTAVNVGTQPNVDFEESADPGRKEEKVAPPTPPLPSSSPPGSVPAPAPSDDLKESDPVVAGHGVTEEIVMVFDSGPSPKLTTVHQEDFLWDYREGFDPDAFNFFHQLSFGTGGFLIFSPGPSYMAGTLNQVLKKILQNSPRAKDIILAVDATNSMDGDITNLQKLKSAFLKTLKDNSFPQEVRLGLIAYRDLNNDFVAKISLNLTRSQGAFENAVDQLRAGQGNKDTEEATLDALELALSKDISWRSNSERILILIGDAPGHLISHSSGQTVDQVLTAYRSTSPPTTIYSILAGSFQ